MYKNRHVLVPAAYLMLFQNGKVLLQRRCNTGYEDGKYGLPSGHIEANESAINGCIREIKEEINIDLLPEDLAVVHVMHRLSYWDDGTHSERVDFFLTTKKYSGEIKNNEPEKCDDLSWFALDRLPDTIIPYIKTAIEFVQAKKYYSELGFEKNKTTSV